MSTASAEWWTSEADSQADSNIYLNISPYKFTFYFFFNHLLI